MSKKSEDRSKWKIGQRVARPNSNELGTVVQTDGMIKVKWDDGSTSYFRHKNKSDIKAAPPE
jgi:hypothetical protein